jgi:hypothetical protein
MILGTMSPIILVVLFFCNEILKAGSNFTTTDPQSYRVFHPQWYHHICFHLSQLTLHFMKKCSPLTELSGITMQILLNTHPLQPLFVSRPRISPTRTLKSEVQFMIHAEICYTLKENFEFSWNMCNNEKYKCGIMMGET